MAAASIGTPRAAAAGSDPRAGELARRGVRNGLIASLAMAMVMMVLGIFDRGFFASPSSIWAFWAGPSAYAPTTFSAGFVLGAIGHMMNSAALGIAFAFVATRIIRPKGLAPSLLSGITFALVVMAIMWVVVLPLSPNGTLVKDSAATWIWIVGHAAYGMTAGVLYSRSS